MDWPFDGVEFDEEIEAPRGDAQDPRAARPADQRDLRAGAGDGRACGGDLGGDRGAALSRGGEGDPRGGARSRVRAGAPPVEGGRESTRCSSAACARDPTVENGLSLFLVCDNLRKGAALNAVQIVELLTGASLPHDFGHRVR